MAVRASTGDALSVPFRNTMPNEIRTLSPAPARLAKAPRLVARLYATSNHALRAQLLRCLLRPLGLLGAVGAAAGAFSNMVLRHSGHEVVVLAEDLNNITPQQVVELVGFAQQVNPDVLRQVVSLVSQHPMGMAASTAAVLVLLQQTLFLRPDAALNRSPPASATG